MPKSKTPRLVPKQPAAYTDEPVMERGEATTLTFPVAVRQRISPDDCPALSDFLNTRVVRDIQIALDTSNMRGARAFLKDLTDPTKADLHIVDLAYLHQIDVLDLMAVWRNHKLTTAMGNFIERLPEVANHTVDSALNRLITCNRCDGAGVNRVQRESGYEWISCYTCEGTGKMEKPGDNKNREMVFKATGIIKPDQHNINVTTIQAATVESVIDELERLPPTIDSVAIPMGDS